MIRRWWLSNFKSVYEQADLDLAPLTIFAGANSAGKSTFIQSILLVAQTLNNQVYSRPVILNGRIIRFGSFEDLASSRSGYPDIRIGLRYEPPASSVPKPVVVSGAGASRWYYLTDPSLKYIECDFTFSASRSLTVGERSTLQPELASCRISCNYDRTDSYSTIEIVRSTTSPEDRAVVLGLEPNKLPPEQLESLRFEIVSPRTYKAPRRAYYDGPPDGTPVGARLAHFLPMSIALSYDEADERARKVVRALIKADPRFRPEDIAEGEREYASPELLARVLSLIREGRVSLGATPAHRTASIDQLIREASESPTLDGLIRLIRLIPSASVRSLFDAAESELIALARGGRPPEPSLMFVPAPPGDQGVLQMLFSEAFRYLGPLRDEPKAVYPVEGSVDPGDVGLRGEFTAAVLDLHKNTPVSYLSAGSIASWDSGQTTPSEASLQEAVVDWMNYMGVVDKIATKDMGVFGHQLQVASGEGEEMHNLVHVGVGVSQILPILVMCLLAGPGAVIVLEQPELHLHPRVQTRLADFLLSLAMSGRQCIVETHSEYLINRLRLRAVEDSSDEIAKRFALYFAEKVAGRSRYRKIPVNEYGAIADWPEGFFDQTTQEAESILRAAVEKRKARAGHSA